MKIWLGEKVLMTFLSNSDLNTYGLYTRCLCKYKTEFLKHKSAHGNRDTLHKYKTAYQFLVKRVLALKPDPIAYCKVDKDNIPKLLWPLRPLLKLGRVNDLRAALSIARVFETIYLPISPELNKITDPGVTIKANFRTEFTQYCERWFADRKWTLTYNFYSNRMIHTQKAGPNGQALVYSHYDIWALQEDHQLLMAIFNLNQLTGNEWINDAMEGNLMDRPDGVNVKHSRLGFIPEPGGKTRTFAIGDYWSQMSLMGIHKMLFKILRTIKADGTHDQDKGFKRILKEAAGKETFCFDLSGATDRTPIILQSDMLSALAGQEIANLWRKVIADRVFQSKFGELRWEVGQPLGLLSSWAAFALWHHLHIKFLAYKLGYKSFNEYAVLGDDVVIWNDKVASSYEESLGILGIPINQEKSIKGNRNNSQIEYAKRIAIKGVELSGIKYTSLNHSSLRKIPELVDQMVMRSMITEGTEFRPLLVEESPRRTELLNFLVWTRLPYRPPLKGGYLYLVAQPESFPDKFQLELREERRLRLERKVNRLIITMDESPLPSYFKSAFIHYSESAMGIGTMGASSDLHPLVRVQAQLGADLEESLNRLHSDDYDEEISPVEYLPDTTHKLFFSTAERRKKEYLASLSIDIYRRLKDDRTLQGDTILGGAQAGH